MSRTPLREALAELDQEGLVRIVPRRGIYILRKTEGNCPLLIGHALAFGQDMRFASGAYRHGVMFHPRDMSEIDMPTDDGKTIRMTVAALAQSAIRLFPRSNG